MAKKDVQEADAILAVNWPQGSGADRGYAKAQALLARHQVELMDEQIGLLNQILTELRWRNSQRG